MSPRARNHPLVTLALAIVLLTPVILVGFSATAVAASTGTPILTDLAGDAQFGRGPSSDVVRIGATSDTGQIHFFTQVASPGVPPPPTGQRVVYDLYFTTPAGKEYFARAMYQTSGALDNTVLWESSPAGGINGVTITAEWTGNELRMDINRANIGGIADGQQLTGVHMLTHRFSVPTDEVYDDETPATYVVGALSTTAPGAPQGLVATGGNAQVLLTWNAPASNGGAAIQDYKVYRGTTSGGETLLASLGGTNLTFTDGTAQNGVTYFYKVSAVNSVGEGALSSGASATPSAGATVPSAPQSLSASAGDARVTLVWSAPATNGGSTITNYLVYRGTTSGSLTLLTTLGSALTFTDLAVTNGVTYYYKVAARNGIGVGAQSAEASAKPAAPRALSFSTHKAPNYGADAGEPTIGVNWNTGNVFIQANYKTIRAQFDDSTSPPTVAWADVSAPGAQPNLDPYIWVDNVTGRIMQGGIQAQCSVFYVSDNDGQSWTQSVYACAAPGVDHETVASGPYREPAPPAELVKYPRVFYYCTQTGGDFCAYSWDGGITFNPPSVSGGANCVGGFGHVKVANDGTAYVPHPECATTTVVCPCGPGLEMTEDNGLTWRNVLVATGAEYRQPAQSFDPSVAVTTNGWLYYAWEGANQHPYVSISKNKGATWSTPRDLASTVTPSIRSATFMAAVAGDDDRAAIAFLGTTQSGNAFVDGFNGWWDLYVSMTYDGGVTWETVKVTEDPVQRGFICAGGTTGCEGGHRNLLDFMDAQMDKTGRVLVPYADGCLDACALPTGTPAQSTQKWGHIARQSGGKTLFAAYDDGGQPALTPSAGGPYAGLAGSSVQLAGGATGGTSPYAFAWSVATKPVGSTAGATSFSNVNSATPTFTPDKAGNYELRLTVSDAAGGAASATATLTATGGGAGQCATGGVVIAEDASIDGGTAGEASEALCLRVKDDASFVDFFVDLKGTTVDTSKISADNVLYYDLRFAASWVAGQEFLISTTYDGSSAPSSTFVDPNTFLPIPGKTATASFEGDTLHVRVARSELLAPANGEKLEDLFLNINHCEGNLCATLVEDDLVPDGKNGLYTLGNSGGSGGGVPLPECSVVLASDTEDSIATDGKGSRELLAFKASDSATELKICWQVKSWSDRPTGASSATSRTRYNAFWQADYESANIAYSVRATFEPDGTLTAQPLVFKGVCAQGNCQTLRIPEANVGGSASAEVKGNVVIVTIAKSTIGDPQPGESSSGWTSSIRDDNGNLPTEFDRAPDGLTTASFTFGQTFQDTEAPAQVTGLVVSDPQTGDSLNLAWSAATDNVGVTSYAVKRATVSGGPYAVVGTPSATSFVDTGLTAGTTYYYVVAARDAANNEGAASAQASATPTTGADTTPPSVPTGLAASGTTMTSVTLSWEASADAESGIASYGVYRDGALVGSPTTTTYADTGLTPATTYAYAVRAVNGAGLASAQSATLSVETLPRPPEDVSVTAPEEGQSVVPPFTFQGEFTTSGQPATPTSTYSADEALPWPVREWVANEFVQDTLRAPAFASLQRDLSSLAGYMGAYPTEDGSIRVLLSGATPSGAPTLAPAGWPIGYDENVAAKTLLQPAGRTAKAMTLAQLEARIASGSPPGPVTPSTQQQVGPGGAIQVQLKDSDPTSQTYGQLLTYVCTASYLYEDPATGKYYLMTAGHCLIDNDRVSSVANPEARARWVAVCIAECVDNYLGLGEYVQIQPSGNYHPVAWANNGGPGRDAGLIEIPEQLYEYLRPWMWFWSGPTAFDRPAAGDALVHYGHGTGVGLVFPTQGRAGVAVSASKNAGIFFQGAIAPGDSGSAIGTAKSAQDAANSRIVGDGAAGIITHIRAGVPNLGMWATDLEWALDAAQPILGFRPQLVTQDATIRLPDDEPTQLAASIVAPSNGTTLDPSATPVATIQGSATAPLVVGPGTDTTQYFLHRTACGTGQVLYMSKVQTVPGDAGACGSLAQPVGPVWEAVLGPIADVHPADQAAASPILLDRTRDVEVTMYLSGYRGAAGNPQPIPSVINDFEATLSYGLTQVGSVRQTGELVMSSNGVPQAVTLKFKPTVDAIPAGETPTLTFVVHHSVGPVFISYGGANASNVVLPLGVATPAIVQVAIDDPTFSPASQLLVTGSASWSAAWDLAGVASGAHTIYARATQGASVSPAVSVGVTVADTVDTPPTADFSFTTNGLTASFTDASTPGSSPILTRTWSFGDAQTGSGATATHAYAAPGTYSVTLTVRDENGLAASKTLPVTVSSATSWAVQVRLTGPSEGFDWRTVATPSDGETGTWTSPWSPPDTPLAGAYTLDARLVRDGATVASATRGFNVPVLNQPPVVSAGADVASDEGASVSLTGSAVDPDGDAVTFAWSQLSGPSVALASNGASVAFTPIDADGDRTYVLRLTATDTRGGSASDDVTIFVRDADQMVVRTIDGVPVQTAIQSPLDGTVSVAGYASLAAGGSTNTPPVAVIGSLAKDGLTVSASGAASHDADGAIVSYLWAMGDGATKSGASVTHTYAAAGTYDITLTVVDDVGAAGQAIATVTVAQTQPPAGFVADAGDSSFVKIGDLATLTAGSTGGASPVAYAWDTNGDNVPDTPGQSIQVSTAGRSAGAATFKVFATDAEGRTSSDSVNVHLYDLTLVTRAWDKEVLVGVNDEDAGQSGAVDGATQRYDLDVPAGTQQLDVMLTWQTRVNSVPANPATSEGGPNDFDLTAYSPGSGQDETSADFNHPESVSIDAPAAGRWQLEVRSYVVANDRYALYANMTTAPVSRVPVADQASDVCFSTPTQLLRVTATPGATGAWDLDLDGQFDDATGLTATTTFASGAHLVRFRATSAEGYRDTITVALRVASECANAPSVVVIGVADTGINPYHRDFAGELIPYPELRDFTTADPANLDPRDRPTNNKVTGEPLPFTRHPATYIPGFPADAQALPITLGGGYYQSLDASIWATGHGVVPLNTWFWIPGTKIVGAIDTGDSKPVNGAADNIPILDEDGHGTASVSVAAGNYYGSCPRCVIAFAEDFSGADVLYQQPWIDFVTVSGGSLANVGGISDPALSKIAAERGQTISWAAGNGVDLSFLTPENTYTSTDLGPDWTIDVGAIQKGTESVVHGTGKPVDWSSYGAGAISAACPNNYNGDCGHSGTSSATPQSTGHLADALLVAREALGDAQAGQKTPAQAGGKLQAIAVGDAIPGSPYLADGVLQRPELWRVAFRCATPFGNAIGFPGTLPASDVDYAYGGYGIANNAMATCAKAALLTGGALRDTPDADAFYEVDEAIRDELWGDWDGDADGSVGGNFNGATSIRVPSADGLQMADVDTLSEAAGVLRALQRDLGVVASAPAVTEAYFLHQTDGCATGSTGAETFMDHVDSTGDDDGCGGIGTSPLLGNVPVATYPSTVASVGFDAGALVGGTIFLDYVHPGAPIVTVVLKADGAEVGRSAPMQVPSTGAFGATGYTAYEFSFPTATPIAQGAALTLDLYVQGSEAYFLGYEGDHASGFTITGGTGGGGGGDDKAAATIAQPAQGQAVQGVVNVAGTATFPATATATNAYLRWDGDSTTCGPSYLSLVDGPDGGNGCQKTLGIAGGALDLYYEFPYDGSLSLVPGGNVGGTLAFNDNGPSPGRFLLVVKGNGVTLGSQLVEFTHASGVVGPTLVDVDIDLEGLTSTAPITDLSFEVDIEQQGASTWIELEDPASFIVLPVAGAAAGREVQVAIDDPTFATGRLVVTGTTEWSASWDASAVAPGAHTIYARAGVAGDWGAADSVGVLVESADETRTAAVQVAVVPAGGVPDGAAWTTATLDAQTRAWSYPWDTMLLANGEWDFHARLLADGSPVKTTTFTATLANSGRAPTIESIADQFGNESQPVSFTVRATDLDGDDVTMTASGVPTGASFVDNGDGTGSFSWSPTFDQAGTYVVTFTARDATGREGSRSANIVVRNLNRAPVLEPIGDRTIAENSTLTLVVSATDEDGGALTYTASGLPAGATFDATTRTFSWTPTFAQEGTYAVTFTVRDDAGETDDETITVTVTHANAAPVIDPIGSRAVDEGERLAFTVTASDADGDAVTLSAANLPPGASFNEATGAFEWTPDHRQAGIYEPRFSANDGTDTTTQQVRITVGDVNRAPELAPIGPRSVAAGSTLTFVVSATDPDNDALTYAASGLPPGATFDAPTGTFSWTPDASQAGAYAVAFSVTDGRLSDAEDVPITVSAVNRPPTLDAIADQQVDEGAALAFTVSGSDPDGDSLTITASGLPRGATFSTATRTFAWTPDHVQAGTYVVDFTASDGRLSSTRTATIVVVDVDRAPTLQAVPDVTMTEATLRNVTVRAADLDGDGVTLAASNLPAWATFVDNADGTGVLRLAPPVDTLGTFTVTLTATANGLSASTTANVTVLYKADVAVASVGPTSLTTSPGRAVTMTANVTNTGLHVDTFAFTLAHPAGWANATPDAVTLAPGETTQVTFSVILPTGSPGGAVTLTARSAANPGVAKSATWTLSVPILVILTPDKETFAPTENPTGVVKATYLDGSPVVGAVVSMDQTPEAGGATFRTTLRGATNATGEYRYDFGSEAGARMPGKHNVRTLVTGPTSVIKTGSYTVALV